MSSAKTGEVNCRVLQCKGGVASITGVDHDLNVGITKPASILCNWTQLTEDEFEYLVNAIIDAYNLGVIGYNGTDIWNIPGAMYFAATVVTTIGYGNITPTTDLSKAMCVIYAIIGIPVFLLVAATIGSKVHKSFFKMQRRLTGKCIDAKCSRLEKIINTSTQITVGLAIFILAPAFAFTFFEPWTYSTSLYYCFITLSTIGFGDYVAGMGTDSETNPVYHIAISVWILFGLAWLSAVINSMQHTISNAVEEHALKVPGHIMVGISRRLSRQADLNGTKVRASPEEDNEEICSVQLFYSFDPYDPKLLVRILSFSILSRYFEVRVEPYW
ncbi:hypothetical protein CAPTEDRAFT_228986 [Capitella teleta]|uniref:Potassium channel domain-containing protein n=1 Tax=Capitella teleta TaxID=283909 RepID=R7TKL4_CAPTE|nr:hypothetical protein CAPTEDRAFT_228986 [Capitella teleta]|eukprot:ELT94323.1 hypothetical protein CAPTEDRAFT_228986 [Capitella teleta]